MADFLAEAQPHLRAWLGELPPEATDGLCFLAQAVELAQRARMGQPVAVCVVVEGFRAELDLELEKRRAHAGHAEGNGRAG